MENIVLNKYQFNKLVKFDAGKNVISTEADIYYYPIKNRWKNEMKALKYFYGPIEEKKQHVLDDIEKNRRSLQTIDAFVLPESQVIMNDEIVGFIMPFINNINLVDVLSSKAYSEKAKLNYIKRIGEVLNKMKKLRVYDDNLKNLFLGDLHEANIIIDSLTGELKIIDLDSMSINGDEPSRSRYLCLGSQLPYFPKKYAYYSPISDYIKTSENTDLYCYYSIIFNYLMDYPLHRLEIDDYYNYLTYLSDIGIHKQFLDKAERIFTPQKNLNPCEDLDSLVYIKEHNDVTSYAFYQYLKK